jgi:Na+/H+ antiporter NhaD/arsenite permease-like protein
MVVNAALTHAGFFRLLTRLTVARARHAFGLLTALCLASGVLSALFLNDTVTLILTPLVIDVCRNLELDPVPLLIALAASANVGSVATITGNPQNLVVGCMAGSAISSSPPRSPPWRSPGWAWWSRSWR